MVRLARIIIIGVSLSLFYIMFASNKLPLEYLFLLGTLLLDLDASDLPAIAHHVVESMIIHDQIRADQKGSVLRVLLLKHK